MKEDGYTKLVRAIFGYAWSDADVTLLPEAVAYLNKRLDTLVSRREALVVRKRFGLDDGRSRTLESVAQDFNVTRERIRQMEQKALRALRHLACSRPLKSMIIVVSPATGLREEV